MARQLAILGVQPARQESALAASEAEALALPFPCLLPAAVSGLILWLCYFPVGWAWLVWIALVPLLTLVRSDARPRRIYFSSWAGGLIFFLGALHWITAASHVGMWGAWVVLAFYCSLYFPLALLLVRALDRGTGLPLVLTFPAVWTALEFCRAEFLTGFAWYFLGHSQHNFLALIQIADVTGVYGVTFLVAAVNALVFELIYRQSAIRSWLSLPSRFTSPRWVLPAQVVGVFLTFTAVLGYGAWRQDQDDFAPGPRVALVQTSIDQRLKNALFAGTKDSKTAHQTIGHDYTFLSLVAFRQRPDLVVGPESSFPRRWIKTSPALDNDTEVAGYPVEAWRAEAEFGRRKASELAAKTTAALLMGVNRAVLDSEGILHRSNSAVLVRSAPGKERELEVIDHYDKIHRVPFGEYIPLGETLPFMNAFSPYDFDYSVTAGQRQTRFPLTFAGSARPVHFGVLICYEDSDPALARRMALPEGDEPAADFIVNISNDGWFNGSSQHEEHLAVCRFRAIESRRAVVRSVNMGVSAVIDGNGKVLAPTKTGVLGDVELWRIDDKTRSSDFDPARWRDLKKTQAVLMAVIPIDSRASLYARWGDWLPWACGLLIFGGLLWCQYRRRPAIA